jgi:hypothetical protein
MFLYYHQFNSTNFGLISREIKLPSNNNRLKLNNSILKIFQPSMSQTKECLGPSVLHDFKVPKEK